MSSSAQESDPERPPAPPPPGPPGPPGPPPPPGPPGRRFDGPWTALGVLLGIVGTPLLLVLALSAGAYGDGALVLLLLVAAGLVPPVVGSVLALRGSPNRRGFGLGLLIGWAVVLVIGGGACIALISALSSAGY